MSALVLHYAPRTRARTALWLLEELELDYALESFDIMSGHQRTDAFRELNPLGKVPVVVHEGRPVAELGAIAIYLADRFPDAGLAPAIDAPDRGDFLRWCFFSSAVIEPCLAERFFKWDLPSGQVAWGSFDRMVQAFADGLGDGPWLLGEPFTAADVLVASGLRFGLLFGAIPEEEPFVSYVDRATARPACARAEAIEERESKKLPAKG